MAIVITGQQDFLEPYERGHGRRDDAHRVTRGPRGEGLAATCRSAASSRRSNDWRTEASKRDRSGPRAATSQLAESLVAGGHREVSVRHRQGPPRSARCRDLEPARPDSATSVDDGRVRTAQAFVVTVLMALAVTAIARVPRAAMDHGAARVDSRPQCAASAAACRRDVDPQGPPELRQVATAVDEMQRTISQQRDDAIRAREAIEQSAILARAGALRARRAISATTRTAGPWPRAFVPRRASSPATATTSR